MESLALFVSLFFLSVLLSGPIVYGLTYISYIPSSIIMLLATLSIILAGYWIYVSGLIWVGLISLAFSIIAIYREYKD